MRRLLLFVELGKTFMRNPLAPYFVKSMRKDALKQTTMLDIQDDLI
jgi:hypothetical protein